MVIIMVEAQTISLRFSRRTHQPTYTKYAHQFILYYLHSFVQVKEYELTNFSIGFPILVCSRLKQHIG